MTQEKEIFILCNKKISLIQVKSTADRTDITNKMLYLLCVYTARLKNQ